MLRDSETTAFFPGFRDGHWRYTLRFVDPIHPRIPRCLNEATPRRKHLLFQLPLLRLEIPPWSDDLFKFNGKWHEMKKKQDSPSFFCSCENCWKRRYPAKCELKNACEFWEDVEAGIFSGNLFWMVLTCFGLKVYTKNVKCAVTTNSSPIVSSSSSPFKSRVSCILGTWILGGVHQIHKFLWN